MESSPVDNLASFRFNRSTAMRILFLCGSLEPGRDGVGDYVRALAEVCLEDGHACATVALNDPFIDAPAEQIEPLGSGKFAVLRLPSALSWLKRERLATAFRDKFEPDWTSIQLVCYGLDAKGLIGKIVPHLKAIVGKGRAHLMLHELWVGLPPHAPFKHRIIGAWQKRGVLRLCRSIRPKVVTTSNPLYVEALRRSSMKAELLPLFGNIPIVDRGSTPEFPGWLGDIDLTPANRAETLLGLFFGGLYAEWESEPFFSILQRAAKTAGKRIVLISLGRPGAVGKEVWQRLQEEYPALSMPMLGEQPVDVVSILMQAADFGVAASPWDLIGKSGSATAMIEHGLPVIVTRQDRQSRFELPEPPSTDPLFHLIDDTLEEKLITGLPKGWPRSHRHEVASRFCALLEETTS